MKNVITFVLCLYLFITSGVAQQAACGFVVDPKAAELLDGEGSAFREGLANFDLAASKIQRSEGVEIPVVAHILRKSDGSGGTTRASVEASLNRVNNFYQSMNMVFVLCDVKYINNDTYYNSNLEDGNATDAGIAVANNVSNVINVYCCKNTSTSWANFPYEEDDFLIMNNSHIDNPSTFSHEMGHYFGLYHTHETYQGTEAIDGSDCAIRGDLICDTPADPVLSRKVDSDCNYTGDAAYTPDTRNMMAYTRFECRSGFTSQQARRMVYAFLSARNYLNNGCGGTDGKLVSRPELHKINNAGDGINLTATLTKSYTKEAWVKLSAPQNGKENNIISGRSSSEHAFWIANHNNYHLAAGHNGQWAQVKAPAPFPAGWHHVAVTYNEGTRTMKLYQDGKLVGKNTNVAPVNGDEGFMQIGRFENSYNLIGEVRGVAVWSYARSEEQIINSGVLVSEPKRFAIDEPSDGISLDAQLTKSYTKEAWVNLSSARNGKENNIISGRGSSAQHAFWIANHNNYHLAAGHNNQWALVKAPAPFPTGWHHVAVTYDESSKIMKLYQDGELVSTKTNVPPFNGTDGFMQIGRYDNGYNLNGEVKKVIVWGYARSEQQIQEAATGIVAEVAELLRINNPNDGRNLGARLTKSYTKEAWVKLSAPQNGKENNIISGRGSAQHAFWIANHNNYHLAAGHNNQWALVKAPNPFPSGWHHVAVTYDEISKTMKLYQDGTLVATKSDVPPFNGTDGFMQIGRYEGGYNLIGEVKKAIVWNYARTQDQINESVTATEGTSTESSN